MTVVEAAKKAFAYVAEMESTARDDMTAEEFLEGSDVAVESARHDEAAGAWIIGVGFVRPWQRVRSRSAAIAGYPDGFSLRTVKYVTVSEEKGEMLDYK